MLWPLVDTSSQNERHEPKKSREDCRRRGLLYMRGLECDRGRTKSAGGVCSQWGPRTLVLRNRPFLGGGGWHPVFARRGGCVWSTLIGGCSKTHRAVGLAEAAAMTTAARDPAADGEGCAVASFGGLPRLASAHRGEAPFLWVNARIGWHPF